MTDWDAGFDDHMPGSATEAFVNAFVWLITKPFDLCARLRNRANGDPLNEQSGADWGGEHFHNGDL